MLMGYATLVTQYQLTDIWYREVIVDYKNITFSSLPNVLPPYILCILLYLRTTVLRCKDLKNVQHLISVNEIIKEALCLTQLLLGWPPFLNNFQTDIKKYNRDGESKKKRADDIYV